MNAVNKHTCLDLQFLESFKIRGYLVSDNSLLFFCVAFINVMSKNLFVSKYQHFSFWSQLSFWIWNLGQSIGRGIPNQNPTDTALSNKNQQLKKHSSKNRKTTDSSLCSFSADCFSKIQIIIEIGWHCGDFEACLFENLFELDLYPLCFWYQVLPESVMLVTTLIPIRLSQLLLRTNWTGSKSEKFVQCWLPHHNRRNDIKNIFVYPQHYKLRISIL